MNILNIASSCENTYNNLFSSLIVERYDECDSWNLNSLLFSANLKGEVFAVIKFCMEKGFLLRKYLIPQISCFQKENFFTIKLMQRQEPALSLKQ